MRNLHLIENRVCVFCSKTFAFNATPSKVANGCGKFCSRLCKQRGRKPKNTLVCETCGQDFNASPSANRKFCSLKCSYPPHVERICETCGKTFFVRPSTIKFSGAKVCSRQCTTPLIDRFFRYIWGKKQENGCILWTGCLNEHGYGVINKGARQGNILAHRASYEFFVSPIPDGLFALHRCDTPACINPTHLFLGTQQDNMKDMAAKKRSHKRIPGSKRWIKDQKRKLRTISIGPLVRPAL